MDLDSAIKAHAEWKTKFRSAISAKQQMDAAAIAKDNVCPLGMWLHGEAKAKYSGLKSYSKCVAEHAGFHKEAGKVAALINAGRYAEAESSISGGTTYSAASSNVGVAVIGFRKEAAI